MGHATIQRRCATHGASSGRSKRGILLSLFVKTKAQRFKFLLSYRMFTSNFSIRMIQKGIFSK